MELSEHETILIFNDADLKEGFFRFSTTKLTEWNKLLKIVGSVDYLMDLRINEARGRVTGWQCKIPRSYLSKSGWKVGRKRSGKVLNDVERAKLRARLVNGKKKG